jgi:hypothetical protein
MDSGKLMNSQFIIVMETIVHLVSEQRINFTMEAILLLEITII